MPVELAWDHDLPVLIVTYQGELSAPAYRALIADRSKALQKGPDAVVVLADMRGFEGFPDARTMAKLENVLDVASVRGVVIVLSSPVFNRLNGMVVDDETRRHYVYVYDTMNQALDTARQMLR